LLLLFYNKYKYIYLLISYNLKCLIKKKKKKKFFFFILFILFNFIQSVLYIHILLFILFYFIQSNFDNLINIVNNSECSLYNIYSPTEAIYELESIIKNNLPVITIGRPTCNSKIYILYKKLKPVPVGLKGEIYISGYGVGKGYLNKEKLTNEKFIECPFNNEKGEKRKMYKSGDLGKWSI